MDKMSFYFKKGFLRVFLSLLVLPFFVSTAFSDWTVVNPTSQVSSDWDLWSVFFIDSSRGWAVGEDFSNKRGALLTFSGGVWTAITPQYSSSNWGLRDLHLLSSNEGWAVGVDTSNDKGILLLLKNGDWTPLIPPMVSSSWSLVDVHLTSSSEGWAVGADLANKKGVLLHYKNDWASVDPPFYSGSSWYLTGVHFTSPQEGWAVGSDISSDSSNKGVLLHHSNGSWTSVSPPTVSTSWLLNDVFLTSSAQGWAVGSAVEGGVLLHYSQGIWTSVTPPNISNNWYLIGVHFTSSSEGWAVGYDRVNKRGVLLHYSNGKWESVPPPQVSSDWELREVYLISPDQGWAVGLDHTNKRGILLNYTPPETITIPNAPSGPTRGNINTSYTYSTGGSMSSKGDPIQYRLDWGDGTKSGWLPVGQKSIPKSWTSSGTYLVKAQARCNKHPEEVFSGWSEGLSVDISGVYFPITLASPTEGTPFELCSLYVLPTFEWTVEESFRSYEIQFSINADFSKIPVTLKTSNTSVTVTSNQWKKVLLLPSKSGGTVYWRVVGTRADKTTVISQPFSMMVGPPKPVQKPNLSPTSKTALPELTWENTCNVKFKVWFGNDLNFKKRAILNFNIKNPLDNGGLFEITLTSRQWGTIRKLVEGQPGATLYFYIESWDGVGRYAKTEMLSFVLTN